LTNNISYKFDWNQSY